MNNLKIFFFAFTISISFIFPALSDNIIDSNKIKNKVFNFSTEKKDNGMVVQWELDGALLEQYSNEITHITKPKLKVYDIDLVTNINSETATDPSGRMEEIYLKDNVYIHRKMLSTNTPVKMYTSYAIFYVNKNIIETDQDVTIITSDSKTTGTGLSANIKSGLITILSNATRIVKSNNEERTIQGNQMIYNSKTERWIVKDEAANNLKNKITKKVITTFNIK